MQQSIPAALMRGGTSRGLFLRLSDLPPEGASRDDLLLELLGSPDPVQVDGVGGGTSHTSKVMAVEPSTAPGVDVDYLFAQVDVRRPIVDYGGNCGNLTAAVGAYAIEQKLVPVQGDEATVVLRCLNTDSLVRVSMPVVGGSAKVQGDFEMAGIVRPGARVEVHYLSPEGAMFRRGTFPTGHATERVSPEGFDELDVSIVDVTSPVVFVRAADLGLEPPFVPDLLNGDSRLLAWIEAIRGICAQRLGLVSVAGEAVTSSPGQPKLAICAPAGDYVTSDGRAVSADEVDLVATMSSMQRIHHAFAGTGVMCTAAAARLTGTIPAEISGLTGGGDVRIGHPKGVATAGAFLEEGDSRRLSSVAVSRTVRTIMTGDVYFRTKQPGSLGTETAARVGAHDERNQR